MTVRVAQKVGFDQISKITNDFGIYNEIPEVLSVSLRFCRNDSYSTY